MHSAHPDDAFRAAALRLYGGTKASVHPWAAIQRTQDGGAFVDVTVFVSAEDVAREVAGGDRRRQDVNVEPEFDRRTDVGKH